MEDAMIINKASLDRGFAHGTLIKSETVDLAEKRGGARVRAACGCHTLLAHCHCSAS
jgi:DNA-directed RNA polymerase beta subunit